MDIETLMEKLSEKFVLLEKQSLVELENKIYNNIEKAIKNSFDGFKAEIKEDIREEIKNANIFAEGSLEIETN